MANVNIEITLGTKGNDAGPLYDIYYSADCVTYTIVSSNVYLPFVGSTTIIVVPETTRCVKLVNLTSICENNFVISGSADPTTTTTLAPTTTTTTILPTTSTTTFSPDPCICTQVIITSAGGEVATFNCYGVNQNYVYANAGTYHICAAEIGGLLQASIISGTGTITPVGNCKTGTCPPGPTTTTTTTLGASFCWRIYNPTAGSLTVEYYNTINEPVIAGIPGGSTDWICVYGGTTPTDYEGGGLVIESCGIQCTSSDTCTDCVPPTTTIAPTTTTLSCYSCGSGTISLSTFATSNGTYPIRDVCSSTSECGTFNYDAIDRPNRFNLYDSTGLIGTSGWVGYATYAGPWGSSLNVSPSGFFTYDFASTTGRYVLVEYGNADPISPISDAAQWSLTCGTCPTTTTTIAPTTTTTATTATLSWSYIVMGGATGNMRLYVNSTEIENRTYDATGTWPVYVGDVIRVEIDTTGCSGANNYANSYCTGIIGDADCAVGSAYLVSTTYTVVSGDIGNILSLATTARCDNGCV
jgi:hypothetical protein